MSKGKKYDNGKLRMDLIPPLVIESLAKVLTYGADKYGDSNWKGVSVNRYVAALWRHVIAYGKGEDIDKESGLLHLEHALTNVAFLIYKYYKCKSDKSRNVIPK
jgi:hypothetical protein